MAEAIVYRQPVFSHDNAEKAWGKSYWALSGKAMLDWILSISPKKRLGIQGWYDHRPCMNPIATRNICWVRNVEVGEIPEDIVKTYSYPLKEYPSYIKPEDREEYLLKKSWVQVIFKWDTMSVAPNVFNTLLAKILASSNYNKIALAILDTKDLYVNYNPVEWSKVYNKPYPVEDLDKQKELYEQWLTWTGFKRFYTFDGTHLISTPWYYRLPEEVSIAYGSSIREFPEYQVHPLPVMDGIFYPPGLKPYEGQDDV